MREYIYFDKEPEKHYFQKAKFSARAQPKPAPEILEKMKCHRYSVWFDERFKGFKPKKADKHYYDAMGRIILPWDKVIMLHKNHFKPFSVYCFTKTRALLEDEDTGARTFCDCDNLMVVTDQLRANEERKNKPDLVYKDGMWIPVLRPY